ncbi:MAG: Crp/Fnr family transcriptional regulator [Cyclobacteriaceae bacterium]|nr:Crp/Fnr family transcriptional regulator [Cyclobacteriaceae bacterium]
MDEYTGIRNFASRFLMFTEEEWKLLTSIITRRFIKKGEYILRGGEVCNHVTFINKGFMRVYNVVHDEELTINFAFEGNFITDFASLISRQPTTDYIIAMDDAEILQMSYQDLQKTYEKSHVWERFGRLMAEYILLFVVSRNKSLLFNSPEERYLKLIKERPKVMANVPLKYIASYLGITPEALSRIRKRLADGQ